MLRVNSQVGVWCCGAMSGRLRLSETGSVINDSQPLAITFGG